MVNETDGIESKPYCCNVGSPNWSFSLELAISVMFGPALTISNTVYATDVQ